MENASKALLIAGGILIGLIVVLILVIGYKEISDYYISKESALQVEQLDDFNKQYTPYYRDDVRGSDLLSLINKIVNYNTLNEEEEPIEISIIISSSKSGSKDFFYKYDTYYSTNEKLILFGSTSNPSYTHNNINARLLNEANRIESIYSQALATKLANNLSTLMGDNTRKTIDELFAELKLNPSDFAGTNQIQEDMLKYYQYIQFKRAHFDCRRLTFTDEGRVQSFRFEFNGTFE